MKLVATDYTRWRVSVSRKDVKTAGIILCGGQSTRMGQPKAFLPFGKELLLPRIARLIGQVASPIIVVAAPAQLVPDLPSGVELVRDEREDRGPLEGMLAGLAAIRDRTDAVYLSACDVPFLRPQFVKRLIELIADHRACVPRVDGLYYPLSAVYRLDVESALRQLLSENRMRASHLVESISARIIEPGELLDADPNLESLQNVNTPEDYARALARLKVSEPKH